MLEFIIGNYKPLACTSALGILIPAIRRWIICYYDYQKTVHTNNTQLEIERIKAEKTKGGETNVNNLRINKDSL